LKEFEELKENYRSRLIYLGEIFLKKEIRFFFKEKIGFFMNTNKFLYLNLYFKKNKLKMKNLSLKINWLNF